MLGAGKILALVGLLLLLASNYGRQQARKKRVGAGGAANHWTQWTTLAAFGTILAGLVLMYFEK